MTKLLHGALFALCSLCLAPQVVDAQEPLTRHPVTVSESLAAGVEPAAAVARFLAQLTDESEVVVMIPSEASDRQAATYQRVAELGGIRSAAEDDLVAGCGVLQCSFNGTRAMIFGTLRVTGARATVELGISGSPMYVGEVVRTGEGWRVECLRLSSTGRCSG